MSIVLISTVCAIATLLNLSVSVDDNITLNLLGISQTQWAMALPTKSLVDIAVNFSKSCLVEQPTNKKIALIMIGEALRDYGGAQGDRRTCGELSHPAQLVISEQQVLNLVKPIEAIGFIVDLYGVTYPCPNGTSPEAFLHHAYSHSFVHLNATFPKPKQSFGGQIYSFKYGTKTVLDRVDAGMTDLYEQVMFFRFDLTVDKPINATCSFTSPHIAGRHNGHLHGYENSSRAMGHLNMDWVQMIPGSFLPCFWRMLLEDPSKCCSDRCLGNACTFCVDNLNDYVGIDRTLAGRTTCPKGANQHFQAGKHDREVPEDKKGGVAIVPGKRPSCIDGKLMATLPNGTLIEVGV